MAVREDSNVPNVTPSWVDEHGIYHVPTTHEGTRVHVDSLMDDFSKEPWVAAQFAATGRPQSEYAEWWAELRAKVPEVIHGILPASTDKTVRYTRIPSKNGEPALVIRWWHGHVLGYNFDFVDAETLQPIYPPDDLLMMYWYHEGQVFVEMVPWEIAVFGQGEHSEIRLTKPPHWVAIPGGRVRVCKGSEEKHTVRCEVSVPPAPEPEDCPLYHFSSGP